MGTKVSPAVRQKFKGLDEDIVAMLEKHNSQFSRGLRSRLPATDYSQM